MESIKHAWKTEKGKVLAGAVLLALLPVFYACFRCLLDKRGLGDLFLPASPWNDELFYYKLTENVVDYGYPQGYFGFNESHGRCLSFAAWSPLLLLTWVIWGVIFGWNLLSPMLCNMAFLSIALFLFGLWVKPTWKQCLCIAALYGTFIPITRFTLSCIPEAELFALMILMIGLMISCSRSYSGKKIVGMFLLAMLMTWMRPYLILLFFTPYYLWKKAGKRIYTMLFVGITMIVYWGVNHFFSAPYLTDLFYTEWIKTYFSEGVLAGIKYTLWKLGDSMQTVVQLIADNLLSQTEQNSAAGCYYLIFLLLLMILFLRVWVKTGWHRKAIVKGECLLEIQMILCMVGFFLADLLMYRIQEGGRHTLVYIVGCLFLIPLWEEEKAVKISAVIGVLLLVILIGRAHVPYEFALPYQTKEYTEDLESLSKQLEKNMVLSELAPSYQNTIIWTVWDEVEGETKTIDFGAYYAVPKGFGINLCDGGFLDAQLENLQSRYIGTIPGGALEKRCIQAGGEKVAESHRLVVYDMYQ